MRRPISAASPAALRRAAIVICTPNPILQYSAGCLQILGPVLNPSFTRRRMNALAIGGAAGDHVLQYPFLDPKDFAQMCCEVSRLFNKYGRPQTSWHSVDICRHENVDILRISRYIVGSDDGTHKTLADDEGTEFGELEDDDEVRLHYQRCCRPRLISRKHSPPETQCRANWNSRSHTTSSSHRHTVCPCSTSRFEMAAGRQFCPWTKCTVTLSRRTSTLSCLTLARWEAYL